MHICTCKDCGATPLKDLERVKSPEGLIKFLRGRYIEIYIPLVTDGEWNLHNKEMNLFICNVFMHVDMEQYAKDVGITIEKAERRFTKWARLHGPCPYSPIAYPDLREERKVERVVRFAETKRAWRLGKERTVSPHDLYDYLYAILMTQDTITIYEE